MRCESPDVTFIIYIRLKARCLLGPPLGSAHLVSDHRGGTEARLSGYLKISLCVDRILKSIQNLKCEDKSLGFED